jgi:G:T-mismatch repair DNA endonuclease (very short patch repair protein)
LRSDGWKVFTVWECELKGFDQLLHRLTRFLNR